mgnify:CR=1 FL=1
MAEFYLSAFADEAADDLDGQIAALHDAGIRFIEPRSIDGRGILDLSEEELSLLKQKLDAAGIRVGSLGSPIGKYGIDEDFESYKTVFEKALTACRILGTDRMRMFSFFVGQDELKEKRAEVLARLAYMTRRADEVGVKLCHENESRIYGQMPKEVADLLSSLPSLYGIFDPANFVANGADPLEGIRATLPSLSYLHIKDALSDGTILPAGEGEGHIGEILDLVDAHTDAPVMLTVEPHLRLFVAFGKIDAHTLKGKHAFKNNRESFAFAVHALEEVLRGRGYRKGDTGTWKK